MTQAARRCCGGSTRGAVTGLDEENQRHWFHLLKEDKIEEILIEHGVVEDGRAEELIAFKYCLKTATGHIRNS
jgi:hypothetical protein